MAPCTVSTFFQSYLLVYFLLCKFFIKNHNVHLLLFFFYNLSVRYDFQLRMYIVKKSTMKKQAQCRAAGDRSGRNYFEKYVFMSKNFVTLSLLTKNYVSINKTTTFSPLGPLRGHKGTF